MSRIDELIRELCPNGVEFRNLGELGSLFGGLTGKSIADFEGGSARYVSYLNVFRNIATNVDPADFVSIGALEQQRELKEGDIIFTGSSETREECGMSSVLTKAPTDPLYLNSFCIGFRPLAEGTFFPDFSKHLFRSQLIRYQLVRTAQGVTRFNVSKAKLCKVRVPVPPLEVQREIARALDLFQSLEAELEAELEARRRQYAHYRRQLLSYTDDTARAQIGDLFDLRAGGHMPATRMSDRSSEVLPYPCFGGNGIRGYVDEYTHDGQLVLIGRQGALCGNVKRYNGAFFATEHAVVVTPKAEVDMDWAFHMLDLMDLNQFATKSAQPGLAVGNLTRLTIPLPSLKEQRYAASALDSFDALVNDLSIGLPAELAARRKQYEYYRDKLLTFPEAA